MYMTFWFVIVKERVHLFLCLFLTLVVDCNANFGIGRKSLLLFKVADEMEAIAVILGALEGRYSQVAKIMASGFQELQRNFSEKNKEEKVRPWSFRTGVVLVEECGFFFKKNRVKR